MSTLAVATNPESPLIGDSSYLLLPGNIQTLAECQRRNRETLFLCELLSPVDFAQVRDAVRRDTWAIVAEAMTDENHNSPNPVVLYAYSFHIAYTQARLLARALTNARERLGVTHLALDPAAATPAAEPALHWGAADTDLYRVVAQAWAQNNSLTFSVSSPPSAAPSTPKAKPSLAEPRNWWASASRITKCFTQAAFRMLIARSRNQPLIFTCHIPKFYTKDCRPASVFALDNTLFSAIWRRKCPDISPAKLPQNIGEDHDWLTNLVLKRWHAYMTLDWPRQVQLYKVVQRCFKTLTFLGFRPCFVGFSPHFDGAPTGVISEAARHLKIPVSEISHSGNDGKAIVGGVGSFLLNHQCSTVFDWENVSPGEGVPDGVQAPKPRHIAVGSLQLARALCARHQPKSPTSSSSAKPRILYAPTPLLMEGLVWNLSSWDRYTSLVLRNLELLAASDADCIVSLFETPGSQHLKLPERFPGLSFKPLSFAGEMWQADYLVVDSLNGTPAYEGLLTNKPMLLYTDVPEQDWDPDFLHALARRAVCVNSSGEYQAAVEELSKSPSSFFLRHSADCTDRSISKYLRPACLNKVWQDVERALNQLPTDHGHGESANR